MTTQNITEQVLKNEIRENEEIAISIIERDMQTTYNCYHAVICYHKARALSSAMYTMFGYGYTSLTPGQSQIIVKLVELVENSIKDESIKLS